MTPDPIPAIRQRLADVTPSPWNYYYGPRGGVIAANGTPIASVHAGSAGPDQLKVKEANGVFIAAAPDDIRTLLALWDNQQAALRRLVEQWRALAGREEGTEIAWCADQLAALLPPEAEQA